MPCETAAQLWASALAAQEKCAATRQDETAWLTALIELCEVTQDLTQHERTCPICSTPTAARFDGQVMGG